MTISSIAGTTNVALCHQAIQEALTREASLPGLLVFYGWSGLGKSLAAAFVANQHNAYIVQCQSLWTRKYFLQAILKEMGVSFSTGTPIPELGMMISEELALSGRPLIIDEADYLVDKGHIMMVMDLYESSRAPIMMIGEERLPQKIERHEKIHNRILKWVPAVPCTVADILKLQPIYAPGIEIEEALLEQLHTATQGVTRRVATNLKNMANYAADQGLEALTVDNFQADFFTGMAPRRAR
ncbi:Uncharacterised protein [BD1-7 clade bacterium]|uniref:ORC1/DEAH AAA+ ATPase domain-containing protein n=1 Tax=BD1-7 clade bacterium TaxID=2029982 RepID=A0A5S9Q1V2_9GAMM|nr:Uncharacterised protein [BD1-7 clade bacterium]CAA0111887.1 Uncharacterised protein [BD1-7 clade bacterium]